MSTVQTIYDLIQYRPDVNIRADDLIHIINEASRMIAKRLYVLGSDIVIGDLSVSAYAEDSYTASTIAFVEGGISADTITDSANQFVAEGFVSGMGVKSDNASNLGPFKIATVAVGTITLDAAEEVAAVSVGTSITLTSDCSIGYLPADFWGLKGKPYIDGKTEPLCPLPGIRTELSYPSAGQPLYYRLLGSKRMKLVPSTSSDITIKGYYFQRPTELTASTDTMPFNELFDDLIAEYLEKFFRGGHANDEAIRRMLLEGVDAIAALYGNTAPKTAGGLNWDDF